MPLAAIAVVGSVGTATPAYASNYGVELNGTYRVISNGDWAKTNEVFIDEQTVVQTWTMTSSCTSPHHMHRRGDKRPGLDRTAQAWRGGGTGLGRRLLGSRPRRAELGTVSRRHRGHRRPEVLVLGR